MAMCVLCVMVCTVLYCTALQAYLRTDKTFFHGGVLTHVLCTVCCVLCAVCHCRASRVGVGWRGLASCVRDVGSGCGCGCGCGCEADGGTWSTQ